MYLELDETSALLCTIVSIVGGFALLLLLGSVASQKLADVATDTTQVTIARGFQVLHPATELPPALVVASSVTSTPPPLPATLALRYAILHHAGIPEPHFDLMFETAPGSPLATWRSPTWPPTSGAQLIRLDDHRRAYLDYEGPVSNDRGHVTRTAAGTYSFHTRTDTTWELTLDSGARLSLHLPAGTTTWHAGYAPPLNPQP
jgi:hypothetical protein